MLIERRLFFFFSAGDCVSMARLITSFNYYYRGGRFVYLKRLFVAKGGLFGSSDLNDW